MRRAAALTVLLGLAAACSSGSKATVLTPSTAPASTATTLAASVPAGYTGFTGTADHFTIAVPASWRQVDPSSPGATQAVQDLVKANPSFSALLSSGDLAAQGIKFLAADPATASSVNVVTKAAVGARDSDLAGAASALEAQYTKVGGTVTASRSVPLAGHTGLQIALDLKLAATATSPARVISEIQDLVTANDIVYIVTLTGTSPSLPAIADTLRV
ncbi:MAG: hypothetical protein ABR511_12185 [Acidimicrobiales bacterium]